MEIKDILGALKFPNPDQEEIKLEDIVKHVNERFVSREHAESDPDIVKKIRGRFNGEIGSALAKVSGKSQAEIKELGEIKDAIPAVFDGFNQKIEEIKAQAGQSNEKKFKDLEAQFAEEQKAKADYQAALEKTKAELEETRTTSEQKFKSFKVGHHFQEAWAKLPFSEKAEELQKTGLRTIFDSKYSLDLDEDKFVVKTKEGHMIPHPKKSGEFLGPYDVLELEARQHGILKENNAKPDDKQTKTVQHDDGDKPTWKARGRVQTGISAAS